MPAKKTVTFDFKIEPSDYAATIVAMTFGIQKWKRYAIYITWIFSAVCLLLTVTKVFQVSPTMYTCFLLVTVIVGTAWISMQIAIYNYKTKYKTENNFKRQISVDESGFTFRNRSTQESGHNSWEDIARVKELEDYFLVGVNARDAVVIPKRAIRTEREYSILLDLLEGNLNGRFYKL
ncbi:hypothetical protein C3V36_01850 [Lachnospiraceae bacterium oral taxon 500]|nr:hypothetical protein C3V36_01850 [Lachnospiraceae bacterium oral taxon 500]